MDRPDDNTVNWQTLRHTGGSLTISFNSGRPRHIAVIPDEVLEDGLRTTNEQPLSSAQQNVQEVECAIGNAFARGDWQELIEMNSGDRLFQLWVMRSDFALIET